MFPMHGYFQRVLGEDVCRRDYIAADTKIIVKSMDFTAMQAQIVTTDGRLFNIDAYWLEKYTTEL